MESVSLSIDAPGSTKEAVCKQCNINSDVISRIKGVSTLYTNDFLGIEDHNVVSSITSISNQGHDFKVELDGINFSTLALYEVILKFKLREIILDDFQFEYYRIFLKNGLLSYLSFKRMAGENKPDLVVNYSPQYGINNSAVSFCEMNNIPVYFIEGSDNISERYSSLRLWDWKCHKLVSPSKSFWTTYENANFPKAAYGKVTNHIKKLFSANSFSVYSPTRVEIFSISDLYKIPEGKKIVLLTMSSHDEVYAAYYIGAFPKSKSKSTVFDNQVEWVKSTIDFFSKREDSYLIIRIHPRDFTNKRETVISPQYEALQEFFSSEFPSNIIINWPSDNISLYNLLPQVDVLLTGWSITALEASIFRLPVVIYDEHLVSYPGDLFYSGNSYQEYVNNLNSVLSAKELKQSVIKVYQWWALCFYLNNLHLNSVSFSEKYKKISRLMIRVSRDSKWMARLLKHYEVASIKLDSDSTQRFLELINFKADTLLDPQLPYNKQFINNEFNSNSKLINEEMANVAQLFSKHD
jgi:hypothetical protein